ncbi:MAG: polysaccharide biosynthesis tyrosine autokinase [Pedobacter sp.]
MKSEKPMYLPYSPTEEAEEKNVRSIIARYLYHWPVFLICLGLTLGVAYFYSQSLKTVNQVTAKITIKDEKSQASEKDAALQQLNISSQPKLIESEIEILRSRPMIGKLVNDLDLWVSYIEPGRFKEVDLFNASPVKFKLLKPASSRHYTEYAVTILSPQRFSFREGEGRNFTANFGTTVNTAVGSWKLDLQPNQKQWIGKELKLRLSNPEDVITRYQSAISTAVNKSAPIIDLRLVDEVPQRGELVLNRMIEDYKKFNINEKNKETESTLRFIDQRLALLSGELTTAEKNVEGYKSSIGLTDISSKSSYYLSNVQENDTRLGEIDMQINAIGEIEKYANSKNSESVPATIGMTDPGLVSLVSQLSKLQLQKDRLLAITPQGNPIFNTLDEQIKSTKQALKNNIQSIKSTLLSSRRQLSRVNNKLEGSIRSIPGQERQYVSIKRQQGTKETLYLFLLQKREEVAMSYASTLTDVHTVESAFSRPLPSKKSMIYSFAIIAGLILPAGFIFARETFRNKVLTTKEIEKATRVQVISEIVNKQGQLPIVIANSRNSSPIGEQFRALRTNLSQITYNKERGKVILFTSSISGEGKSFVSSNIAVSLALSGRKTIILELDLRKPKLTQIFNLDTTGPGLGDLLNGTVAKEQVIQQTSQHPNLFAMRAGGAVDNPSELLESQRMADLIEALRDEYDNILIDSPPLRLVTDAMILAPLSDMTMYLIRQGYTGKEELEFIKQLEDENALPNLRLIFNGLENDRYGYGYNYDYSYYSGPATPDAKTRVQNFFKRF